MDEPLELQYFKWLYSNVSDPAERLPSLRFFNLFNQLHQTEFVFLISGDDNRMQDGRDLRADFFRHHFVHNDGTIDREGCSVLEMLVAFSRRASLTTDEPPRDWFWEMLNNLGLSSVNDSTPYNEQAVQELVDRFVYRQYDSRGNGGLFPLTHTQKNQRRVEVWYQFNEYLVEIGYD